MDSGANFPENYSVPTDARLGTTELLRTGIRNVGVLSGKCQRAGGSGYGL